MKRASKCIGKRKYVYKDQAIDMARWKYVNGGIILGVYECPTCLDFHLTSKYCNLRYLHKAWSQTKDTYVGGSLDKIKKRRKKAIAKRRKKARLVVIPNPEKRAEKVAKQFYKKSILPISEQKRISASLNQHPRSFWRWLLGIITLRQH